MPLSNYLPSSRLIQPGVCTSSTRPASPFEGQVIYETDTNKTYVWNGSAWIMQISADAPPGLQLIKAQAIGSSAISFVEITNVFSADFTNYRVIYSGGTGSTSTNIGIRLGLSIANYAYQIIFTNFGGSSLATGGSASDSQIVYCGGSDSTGTYMDIDIRGPYTTNYTHVSGNYNLINTPVWMNAIHKVASSHTGFSMFPASGTISNGTVYVYGYRTNI